MAERALATYRALVERQCRQLPEDGRIEVHFTPNDADFEMRQWLGHDHHYYPQAEGELGARLARSVAAAFERGAATVLCIGGDCPQLCQTHFEQASSALDEGYEDIPWSTRSTLDTSLQRAAELGLRVKLLETLYDIDEVAELERTIADGLLPNPKVKHYQQGL